MKRSEFVISLREGSVPVPSAHLALWRGYIPPIHRHRLFLKMAPQLFEDRDYRFGRPYKLHVPRDLMDIYLNRVHYLDHEPLTRRVFLTSLQPGFVVIDVGANLGYYTLLAAGAVGPKGRVHAVESAPLNLRLLNTTSSRTSYQTSKSIRTPQPARAGDLERLAYRAYWVQSVVPLADRSSKRYPDGHTCHPCGRHNSVSRSSRKD